MPYPKSIEQLESEKGKLYGEQALRKANTPAPAERLEPRMPPRFTKEEKAAWRYGKGILQNWGLFSAANGPHLEMFAVNWAWYRHYRDKMREFENERPDIELKPKRNPYLGHMNKFEQKVNMNLANMGIGTMQLAKVGQALARASKKDELEEILD